MVDEVIKYTAEIDTATLAEQLLQIRQEIDDAVAGIDVGSMTSSVVNLSSTAVQNNATMQQLMDRTENFGYRMIDQIKAENFTVRPPSEITDRFADNNFLENSLGALIGYGYNPSSSLYSIRDYMKMSSRNVSLRLPYIGTEHPANIGMANFFQDVSLASIGGQLDRDDAMNLARTVRNLDLDPRFYNQGFTRSEVSTIVQSMASNGDFLSAQNVDDYREKIENVLGNMRSIMHSFRVFGEEAVAIHGQLKDLGYTDPGNAAISFAAQGSTVGLSARDMLVAAQTGGQFSAALGIDPRYGNGFGDLLKDLRYYGKTGDVSSFLISSLGGEAGAMTQLAKTSAQFYGTGPGLLALRDGESIANLPDLFGRMMEGDFQTILDPESGIKDALMAASEVWQQLTDRKPNTFEAARMAEQIFGIPFNQGMLVQNLSEGRLKDPELLFKDNRKELEDAYRRLTNEIPIGGLIGGTKDFFSSYFSFLRNVGNLVKIDDSILRPLENVLLGKSTDTKLDIGGSLDVEEYNLYNAYSGKPTSGMTRDEQNMYSLLNRILGNEQVDENGETVWTEYSGNDVKKRLEELVTEFAPNIPQDRIQKVIPRIVDDLPDILKPILSVKNPEGNPALDYLRNTPNMRQFFQDYVVDTFATATRLEKDREFLSKIESLPGGLIEYVSSGAAAGEMALAITRLINRTGGNSLPVSVIKDEN